MLKLKAIKLRLIKVNKGVTEKHIFEKSMIQNSIFAQTWSVAKVEPDKYFGKQITVYEFTVKNHPLEILYKKSKGTNIRIMISEGKVIGGYSQYNDDVLNDFCSLDGKSLYEVTGLSYQQWQESWSKKYGN